MSEHTTIQAIFGTPEGLTKGLKALQEEGITDLEAFGPTALDAAEPLLPRKGSPVRFVTLAAALVGCALGFWLCIGSALLYGKIVGGKPPVSLIPFCVVGFELTILVGGVTTLAAVLGLGRLRSRALPGDYDAGYSSDKFGVSVHVAPKRVKSLTALMRSAGAERVREI